MNATQTANIARIECLADLEVAAQKYYRTGGQGADVVDALVETYLRFPCCIHLTRLVQSWRDDRRAFNRMSVAPRIAQYASYAQQ